MRIILTLLVILLFLFSSTVIFAAAPVITNPPSTANVDTSFSLNVSMSGLSNNAVYRLRVALAATGTTSYFGSTFNNSSWYNGTPSPINYSNFLSITTDSSGSWSGTVQGKVESSDPNFSGTSGTYDLKVGRYTESGTSATWSTISQITLTSSAPTPTPTPTPEPTSTPTSSSTFTISNSPSSINADQSFSVTINLSLPNNQNTDYFLKGAFKIKDGSRYLGLTKVGGDWREYADDYTDQYKITTDSNGNWTGDLEVKPDTNDKDYKGGGDYIFKVGRYTSGGNVTWSNEQTVHITDNQSTPIPTSTPKPSVALTNISSTKSAINSATSLVSSSNTPQLPILGLSTSSAEASPEAYGDFKQSKNSGIAMIIGGLIIIVGAAGVYLRYKHTHVESNS